VVNISTEKIISLQDDSFWHGYGAAYDLILQQFNRQQGVQRVKLMSLGSGVIVDENGLIITNAHVVKMAGVIYVTLQDGTRLEAKLRYIRHQDDLALLEIEPTAPLKAISIVDTEDILIGESVIAIGNPFGLENSVSAGVVSGKGRSFFAAELGHLFSDLVQTDAAINVGNSGGALLNLNGELVGLNLTVAENTEGIGFAVAADKIRTVVEEFQLADRFHQERQRAIQAAVPE
jgi:serine protease Do